LYRFCTLNDKPKFWTPQCAALLTGADRGDRPVPPRFTTPLIDDWSTAAARLVSCSKAGAATVSQQRRCLSFIPVQPSVVDVSKHSLDERRRQRIQADREMRHLRGASYRYESSALPSRSLLDCTSNQSIINSVNKNHLHEETMQWIAKLEIKFD